MSEAETEGPIAQPPPIGGPPAGVDPVQPVADELPPSSDFARFVGPNLEKFAPASGSTRMRRFFGRPCWPGFFFPVAWFMYRKMYGWAALACALPIFAGVMNFGGFKPVLISLPTVAGLAGRKLYRVGARRTIARIRVSLSGRSEEALGETLARAGGVSVPGAIVGGAIVLVAVVIGFTHGFVAGFQLHYHR